MEAPRERDSGREREKEREGERERERERERQRERIDVANSIQCFIATRLVEYAWPKQRSENGN